MQEEYERSGKIFERAFQMKGKGKKKQLNMNIKGCDG